MCFESKSFMFSESPCRLGLASTCRLTHLSLFTLFWTWLTRRQARLICKMVHSAGFASGRWGATKLAQRTRDANAFVGISILKSSWAHGKATDPHKCFGIDFLHFSHPKQVLRHWLSVIPGGTNPGYLPLSQHKRMHSETHGLGPENIVITPKSSFSPKGSGWGYPLFSDKASRWFLESIRPSERLRLIGPNQAGALSEGAQLWLRLSFYIYFFYAIQR